MSSGEGGSPTSSRSVSRTGSAADLKFAVMLCLYKNNKPDEVREALRSGVLDQTLRPSEVIVVFDGPVPETVGLLIEEFAKCVPLRKIVFDENRGHGYARAAAINACTHDWIGIIDSDDISLPHRFDLIARTICKHPEAAVVGGGLREFSEQSGTRELGPIRQFPETPEQIRSFIRTRSPFAQPTVMLRVAATRHVGNYQTWFNNEDYHLWIRLLAAGYELRNVPEIVLLFRTNPALFQRRGGVKYWWHEARLQWFSLRQGTTSLPQFVFGVAARFVVQVAISNSTRQQFYRLVLRRS